MLLQEIGVTARKESQFKEKHIFSVEDLMLYLPYKYIDGTSVTGLLPHDQISCVIVLVNSVHYYVSEKTKRSSWNANCSLVPTGENIRVTWWNQDYRGDEIQRKRGQQVLLVGHATYNEQYKNYQFSNPNVFDEAINEAKRLYPMYSKIPQMAQDYLEKQMEKAFSALPAYPENLPNETIRSLGLLSMTDALYNVHFPSSLAALQKGEERLLYNDMIYFALKVEWASRNSAKGSAFSIKTLSLFKQVRNSLPYTLTPDQDATITKMIEHVREGKRINALVQGDVGCGKTIVAFLMMVAFVGSGYQTVLMVPTQVLARQHYEDLVHLVEPFGYEVAYLGSELKASEKKKILQRIESGEVKFIVGTQSVIGKSVKYNNLALVITDKEHKFGVVQRTALVEKAAAGVHRISMSATPIPQSLAQVIYGNMVDLYTISTMPKGRKPVVTGIARNREAIYKFVISQVSKGHQVYIVCPRIDKREKKQMEGVKSVAETYEEYSQALSSYDINIRTLTGEDKKDKNYFEDTITQFKAGDIDVLISTLIIEVGINVPNATVMVITNAEQFGLSQLHQLRGRVGRSSLQSYCVLESEQRTEVGQQRLSAMCRTNSGFEIAAEDLKIRGAGDFIGTRQSGEDKYVSLMVAYPEIYKRCQKVAKELLDAETPCPMVLRALDDVEKDE